MGSANCGNTYPETPLLRHGSSLLPLTFDEVQNALGEPGANLGSMNMDELLRNIWTLEESQAMASAMNPVDGLSRGLSKQFSLQKQGSLSLPRTLSTKAIEDVWKIILPQHGSTAASPMSVNHQRQVSFEDYLVKSGAVKERPSYGEVTLEDFLVKAGIVRVRPPSNLVPSNQAFLASGNPVPLNPSEQVLSCNSMEPSSQAHQVPVKPFLVPSNERHRGSTIQTLMPSNPVQQQVSPIPSHQQAAPVRSILRPSHSVQQQVPPIPMHQQATPIHCNPVPDHVPSNHTFMGFGGFPISRDDGGFENKNGQTAPTAMKNFIPTAANALSCPPSSGKTQLDALNSMFLPGQQSDWTNNSHGRSIVNHNQLTQRQPLAEAVSALGSVPNANNGPCLESSPGHQSPLAGGFGAALGRNHGGNAYATRISFGPCPPLSPEFDEGSPETSNHPFSVIPELGNGQLQRKKRSTDPPVERVIERRQRRMIKNRESAARSRARKQAYTVELEAEVSQLKEENMELLRKQEEDAALRKKQILALMPSTPEIACKGRFLKRTHTGPW